MAASICALPEPQLELLLAFAASWLVASRPPQASELRKQLISWRHTEALLEKGLLTLRTYSGTCGRQLRLTQNAWSQLRRLGVLDAAKSEVA